MRNRIMLALAVAVAAVVLLTTGAFAGGKPTPPGHANSHGKSKSENRALFAVLSGRKEVGADGRRGAGDPDARGSFTAIVDGDQLCFGITVTNLDAPTAAHIHKGRPNQNGDIVVPLTSPSSGDPGASSGCVTVDAALAQSILKNPHKYYANVHTAAFPAGAARGQLSRKSH
ncbi:MAG TPA: CHRD domain-containing protein [Solirubrobacteraceae bacterium]